MSACFLYFFTYPMYVGAHQALKIHQVMASKKDLDFAMKGEAKESQSGRPKDVLPEASTADDVSLDDLDAPNCPEFIIFKLVKTDRRGGLHIEGQDEVIDPKTKKPTRIRLLSGVDTIWVKEQKEITDDYVRRNLRSLEFPRGQKFVAIPKWDKTAIEFARRCRHNIGSPNRKTGSRFEFFEYNPKKQAEEQLKKELFEIEMVTLAGQKPIEFVRKHAAYLGIPMADEYGMMKEDEAVRRDYVIYAKRNPYEFKKSMDDKEIEVSFMVRKCLSEQKIDLHTRPGVAMWAANHNTICRMPPAGDPVKHLTALALTNSNEGRDFLELLQSSVLS